MPDLAADRRNGLALERTSTLFPLLRQTSTLCLPGASSPATIELIVLAEGGADGVDQELNPPSWDDLPESRQAGWRKVGVDDLLVCIRIVAD